MFVESLCSQHAFFGPMCLHAIVRLFVVDGDAQPAGEPANMMQLRQERAHDVLQRILSTVPLVQQELMPALIGICPHVRWSVMAQETLCRNLLRVTTYAPLCMHAVVDLLVSQMVKVDVEITTEAADGADADADAGDEAEQTGSSGDPVGTRDRNRRGEDAVAPASDAQGSWWGGDGEPAGGHALNREARVRQTWCFRWTLLRPPPIRRSTVKPARPMRWWKSSIG